MTLRTEPLPGTTDTLAVVYGPIVLVGKLGNKGISPGADLIINERAYGDVLNDQIDVPTLAGDASKLVDQIKPVDGSALTFTMPVTGHADGVTLIPYFRIAHERYNLYWKVDAKA